MNDQNNQTKIKEQVKSICEKIYSKYRDVEEIKEKKIFGVPVWLKHVDKETAQELKTLLEPLKGKPAEELDKYFHYRFWLSQHEEYDPKSLKNCHKFVDNLTGLLGNLEEIINDNKKRKFYDNCPYCEEKIVITIEVHNEPEEWIESRVKELLLEEFKKHLADIHPEKLTTTQEWKASCSACSKEFSVTREVKEGEAINLTDIEDELKNQFNLHVQESHPNRSGNRDFSTPKMKFYSNVAAGTHGNSPGTNFVGREHKCPKCGMTKIIAGTPSNPNPDLNAIWQKHEQSGECAEKQQTDHYKCLKCGSIGAVSDLGVLGNSGWCKCGSKNLECWSGNFHWTTFECSDCHKFRDYKYHGLSPEHEARIKANIKFQWENINQWCGCPRSNVDNQEREREREHFGFHEIQQYQIHQHSWRPRLIFHNRI